MDESTIIMADIHLMYRKTILKSTYRFSKMLDEIIDYESYKKIILYNEKSNFKYMQYLKGIYASCHYILNQNNLFEAKVINVTYHLLCNQNINFDLQVKIQQNYKKQKSMFDNIKLILPCIALDNFVVQYAYTYIVLVYLIYIYEDRICNFSNHFFQELYRYVQTHDYDLLKKELDIELEKKRKPDENYFQQLKEINSKEIIDFLLCSKQWIKENFKLEHLYLYGSFAKNTQRIDSDIDIAGVFDDVYSYETRTLLTQQFKNYITNQFHRYGDFMEYNELQLATEKYFQIF